MKLFVLYLFIFSQCGFAFMAPPQARFKITTKERIPFEMSADQNAEEENSDEIDDDTPVIAQSTVKVNDHGSDLTDRFKWKVHALMGTFDPAASENDNEKTDGNILNAVMTFPTNYVFNIVGKTGGDEATSDAYIEKVQEIVLSNSQNEEIDLTVKPRGKNFTKVLIEAYVESSSMITNIYQELGDLEETVMRF